MNIGLVFIFIGISSKMNYLNLFIQQMQETHGYLEHGAFPGMMNKNLTKLNFQSLFATRIVEILHNIVN